MPIIIDAHRGSGDVLIDAESKKYACPECHRGPSYPELVSTKTVNGFLIVRDFVLARPSAKYAKVLSTRRSKCFFSILSLARAFVSSCAAGVQARNGFAFTSNSYLSSRCSCCCCSSNCSRRRELLIVHLRFSYTEVHIVLLIMTYRTSA